MYFIPTIVIFTHFCEAFQPDFAESGLQVLQNNIYKWKTLNFAMKDDKCNDFGGILYNVVQNPEKNARYM